MFSKIFWVGVFFIICALNLSSQSLPKDSLQSQVNQLREQITTLQQTITNLKVEIDVANRIIDSSNNIVEYSGWIGIGVTILLLTFGFYSYWSFDKSKQEIEKFNNKAEDRLKEAEKKFNDFINSPDRINVLLEEMNFKNVEKEIDSSDEKIFIQGLRRAFVLSKEKKLVLSGRLKSKLYDPELWNHFWEIFEYLKANPVQDIKEIASEYFYSNRTKVGNTESLALHRVLFKERPFFVSPIDFYKYSNDELKSLVISRLRDELIDTEYYNLIEKIFDDNQLIRTFTFSKTMDSLEITKIAANKIHNIDDEDLNKLLTNLEFNEDIYRDIFRRDPLLKILGLYIYIHLKNPIAFKIYVECFDGKMERFWIEAFNSSVEGLKDEERIELLKIKFSSLTPPDTFFFKEQLPYMFNLTYGLELKDRELHLGKNVIYKYGLNDIPPFHATHPVLKRTIIF